MVQIGHPAIDAAHHWPVVPANVCDRWLGPGKIRIAIGANQRHLLRHPLPFASKKLLCGNKRKCLVDDQGGRRGEAGVGEVMCGTVVRSPGCDGPCTFPQPAARRNRAGNTVRKQTSAGTWAAINVGADGQRF